MSGINYIPTSDAGLVDRGEKVYTRADERHTEWGVIPAGEVRKGRLAEFKTKVELCKQATSSRVDISVKNELKVVVKKDIREYVQGYVARNPLVTTEDREIMGLPIYDRTPTSVGLPQGQATAMMTYIGGQILRLHIKHMVGTPADKKANYGCKIYYGVFADSDKQPVTGEDLTKQIFTRRKKEDFTFSPTDVKKTAYFCIRYENSKGQAGAWGPMISALIP